MGILHRKILIGAAGALAVIAGSSAGAAADPTLLQQLEKGRWTLTERGQSAPSERICLGNAAVFLKPQHRGATCSQYVIENKPDRVTIHYSCPGANHGHTIVRRETNRLVQIETQGMKHGRPFDRSIEARRVGGCSR